MRRFRGTYRIETTRLRGYDYASAGWYHIVICTKDRARVFGTVRGGIMGLSRVGVVAHRYCAEIPDHSDCAMVDAFVVMPNHVHAIIGITSDVDGFAGNTPVETLHATSLRDKNEPQDKNECMSEISPDAGSLPAIVRSYKSAVTRWVRRNGHDNFAWQSRYWDRVIRDDRELQRTRRYIDQNPLTWHQDDLFET